MFVKKFPTEEKTALKLYVSKTGVTGLANDYVIYQNDVISRETYNNILKKEKQEKEEQLKNQNSQNEDKIKVEKKIL